MVILLNYYRVGQEHIYGFWDVYRNSLIGIVDTLVKKKKKNTQVQDKGEWDFSYILATFRWKSNLNAIHSAFWRGFGSAPKSRLLDTVSYENTQKVST